MREHLNIAIPMSIQFSILALSIMVIQAVCNSFGEKIIVGFTIALRIEQLATQPLMAIGLAMATFAAQNYGAGKLSRIREAVKKACLTSFVISLLMSTVMFFSAPISSAAFGQSGSVRRSNRRILSWHQHYVLFLPRHDFIFKTRCKAWVNRCIRYCRALSNSVSVRSPPSGSPPKSAIREFTMPRLWPG